MIVVNFLYILNFFTMKKWLILFFSTLGINFLSFSSAFAWTYTGTISLSGIVFNSGFNFLNAWNVTFTGLSDSTNYSCFTKFHGAVYNLRVIGITPVTSSTWTAWLFFRISQSWTTTVTLNNNHFISYVCSDSFGNTWATWATWSQGATGWVTIVNNNYITGITLSGSSLSYSWSSWSITVDVNLTPGYSGSVVSSGTVLPLLYQGNNWEYYLNQDIFFSLFLLIYAVICSTIVSWFLIKHLFYFIINRWKLWS